MPSYENNKGFSLGIRRVVRATLFFIGMQEQERLSAEFEQLLRGAGLDLVELVSSRHRGSVQVRAVVYSRTGTGTKECVTAHRLIYPRLQIIFAIEDPYLEVTSPGIDRVLKTPREYGIFAGKGIKILLRDETEWIHGRLVGLEEEKLIIDGRDGRESYALAEVAKARLDSTQEGD